MLCHEWKEHVTRDTGKEVSEAVKFGSGNRYIQRGIPAAERTGKGIKDKGDREMDRKQESKK